MTGGDKGVDGFYRRRAQDNCSRGASVGGDGHFGFGSVHAFQVSDDVGIWGFEGPESPKISDGLGAVGFDQWGAGFEDDAFG